MKEVDVANILGAELKASIVLDAELMLHDNPSRQRGKYYDKIDRGAKDLSSKIAERAIEGDTEVTVTKGRFNRKRLYAPIVYTAANTRLEQVGIAFKVFAQHSKHGFVTRHVVQIESVAGEPTELQRDLADMPASEYEQVWPPVGISGRSYRTPF